MFPEGIPLHLLYLLAKTILSKKNKVLDIFIPNILDLLK